jgi:outer membrane biosynthesis protein TonB
MEPIKVEINVNVNLSEETKQFVANLLANAVAPKAEPQEQQEAKAPKKPSAPKPSAPAPKPEPEPEPAPKAEPEPAPAPKAEPEPQANGDSAEITRDQVRAACKPKLKTHQAELRAKLEELGATSITTLDESLLAEMYNFANSLS